MLRFLGRVVDVKREELPALGWTWLYFYAVLASYYVIRPIRDEAGVAGGVGQPAVAVDRHAHRRLAVEPGLRARSSRASRACDSSPWSYRFFALNLIVFFVLLRGATGAENIWLGRVFYVWTAVFNLFVPSVFWAFMTDIFTRDQAKRLFGIISAAGTLGAMTGSILTATLAQHIPPIYLLFVVGRAASSCRCWRCGGCRASRERLREVRAAASQRADHRRQRRGGDPQRRQVAVPAGHQRATC